LIQGGPSGAESQFPVEFGDVIANCAGVSCGALLGLPIRALIAIPEPRAIPFFPHSLLRGLASPTI
jgi:hypothetical protein